MRGEAKSQRQQRATLAVVKFGSGGRGFVVKTEPQNAVITAAHCLRRLPPAHPWSYMEERVYQRLLGPFGKAKPTVWAECIFADPLADIAVLGSPDDQELPTQADAYQELTSTGAPFAIADAPRQGAASVLSLDGKWLEWHGDAARLVTGD